MKNSKQLTENDKRILWKLKDIYSSDKDWNEYFNYWGWQRDTSDVSDYFNSYLSSQGFKRIIKNQNNWWEKRHPYRKWYSNPDQGTQEWFNVAKTIEPYRYTHSSFNGLSHVHTVPGLKRRIMAGGRQDDYNPSEGEFNWATGHEYLHGKTPFNGLGMNAGFSTTSAQAEALDQNKNTAPGHDSQQNEKHADIWGLKYLFYKEGIYDSRSNKNITKQQVQKLRKKYPDLRPFQQMNDDMIIFMMNNVAQNSPSGMDVNYAKFGSKIRFK